MLNPFGKTWWAEPWLEDLDKWNNTLHHPHWDRLTSVLMYEEGSYTTERGIDSAPDEYSEPETYWPPGETYTRYWYHAHCEGFFVWPEGEQNFNTKTIRVRFRGIDAASTPTPIPTPPPGHDPWIIETDDPFLPGDPRDEGELAPWDGTQVTMLPVKVIVSSELPDDEELGEPFKLLCSNAQPECKTAPVSVDISSSVPVEDREAWMSTKTIQLRIENYSGVACFDDGTPEGTDRVEVSEGGPPATLRAISPGWFHINPYSAPDSEPSLFIYRCGRTVWGKVFELEATIAGMGNWATVLHRAEPIPYPIVEKTLLPDACTMYYKGEGTDAGPPPTSSSASAGTRNCVHAPSGSGSDKLYGITAAIGDVLRTVPYGDHTTVVENFRKEWAGDIEHMNGYIKIDTNPSIRPTLKATINGFLTWTNIHASSGASSEVEHMTWAGQIMFGIFGFAFWGGGPSGSAVSGSAVYVRFGGSSEISDGAVVFEHCAYAVDRGHGYSPPDLTRYNLQIPLPTLAAEDAISVNSGAGYPFFLEATTSGVRDSGLSRAYAYFEAGDIILEHPDDPEAGPPFTIILP